MNKKTLTIVAVFILIILAAFLIFYFLFLRNTGVPATTLQNPSFGQGTNPETVNPTTTSNNQNPVNTQTSNPTLPILRHISTMPIAGAIAFDVATTTASATSTGARQQNQLETMIEYVESATGHIDETRTDTLDTDQLSLTTIPKLYQAFWTRNGAALSMQYLADDGTENIETYYGQLEPNPQASGSSMSGTSTLGTSATSTSNTGSGTNQVQITYAPEEIQGTFLPENIGAIAVSRDKDQLFYLLENNAGSQIVASKPDGSQSKILLDSPLQEWMMNWVNDSMLSLTTKASSASGGYLYFLNTSTGRLDRILGDLPGLTALANPAGTEVLFAESLNDSISDALYNPQTGTTTALTAVTLPEKCVWSIKNAAILYCAVPTTIPTDNYPDAWYQGLVSFNDDLWSINTTSGTSTLLADPSTLVNAQIDGTHLFLDPRENYLFFTNKKDGTLWSLDLNQQ